jgi:hypothetical protein
LLPLALGGSPLFSALALLVRFLAQSIFFALRYDVHLTAAL